MRFAVVLLAIAAAGCSSYGRRVAEVPAGVDGYRLLSRAAHLPQGRVTADCGPEALCAVLSYFGKRADVNELTLRLYRPELEGTLSTVMAQAARERGLAAEYKYGHVSRLRQAVDEDRPTIIMVEVKARVFHFFVISGYNLAKSEIVCEDYGGAKYLVGFEELEKGWTGSGRYLLELRVAKAEDDVSVGFDYESQGEYGRAMDFYERALKQEPEHADAMIGLANCLYAKTETKKARELYERALKIAPDNPTLCNNLADLYIATGVDAAVAERLASRAVAILEDRRRDYERELTQVHPVHRAAIELDAANAALDVAGALGTLGQARLAAKRALPAIEAWRSSMEAFDAGVKKIPPSRPEAEDAPDWRARRLVQIGKAHQSLEMRDDAIADYRRALESAKDPGLRKSIGRDLDALTRP